MDGALPGRNPARARRRWLELAAWIALWFVARGALALSHADVFFYGEELEKACAGKAMLDGLGVPHHQLAYHYYEGGGFVVSHLDALAFLLFGESLLAVKLVALALGACVLAAGWSLCERFGGPIASRVFALLFVVAPASVQTNSLLALGIHFHAMLFVALVVYFAARILIDGERGARTWFLLGLAGGFGLYFSYQLALTLAVVGVALAWKLRGELIARTTLWGFAGFAIGVAPLAWMASLVGAEVLDIHGGGFGLVFDKKLATLSAFANSFDEWNVGVTVLFVVAVAAAAGFARASVLTKLITAHLLLFLAAYVAGSFTVGKVIHYFPLHRLIPAWFLGVLLIAFGAAVVWQRWPRLRIGPILALGMLTGPNGGAIWPWSIARFDGGWDLLTRTKGYAYAEYVGKVQHHLAGERVDKLRTFLRFDEPDPALLHAALAENLYADGALSIDEVRAELASAGIHDDRGFLRGLGYALRERHLRAGGAKDDIAGRVKWLESQSLDVTPILIEAVGRFGLGLLNTQDRLRRELVAGRDGALPDAYFIGLGYRAWSARGDTTTSYTLQQFTRPFGIDATQFDDFLTPCTPREVELLRRGFELARAERSLKTHSLKKL